MDRSSGAVYVSDWFNQRVQKFDAEGNFLLEWGSYGSADGQFKEPRHIAVDASGDVYVVDLGNARVQKFDSNGVLLTKWGEPGSGPGQFLLPYGITVDSDGNVYVSDITTNRIQKFGWPPIAVEAATWSAVKALYH